MLEGNHWLCDSRMLHLAEWLRRWLREQLRFTTLDLRLRSVAELRQATCVNPETGREHTIFDLCPEDVSEFNDKGAAPEISITSSLFVYFCCYICIRYL